MPFLGDFAPRNIKKEGNKFEVASEDNNFPVGTIKPHAIPI